MILFDSITKTCSEGLWILWSSCFFKFSTAAKKFKVSHCMQPQQLSKPLSWISGLDSRFSDNICERFVNFVFKITKQQMSCDSIFFFFQKTILVQRIIERECSDSQFWKGFGSVRFRFSLPNSRHIANKSVRKMLVFCKQLRKQQRKYLRNLFFILR